MKLLIIGLFLITLMVVSACSGSGQAASSSAGGENALQADAAAGQQLFVSNCSACHGPTGEGITGLGKPLTSSEFIAGLSDEELLAFIKQGRTPDDPLNTSGVVMPPKGGNPALTDEQLGHIIAYIRSIHTN
jgi:disulfide bond formation protein DsbB